MEEDIFSEMYFSVQRCLSYGEVLEDFLRRESEGEPQKFLYSTTKGRVYVRKEGDNLIIKHYGTKL